MKNKEGSMRPLFIVMALSLLIAFGWHSMPFIKNSVGAVLDPTAGALLNLNLDFGFLVLIFIISLLITLAQKYGTDQESLRELKKEQKLLQAEMKKYKDHPEKLLELQKKSFEFIPKTMKLSMRAIAYTAVPIILFFRWFDDFFEALGDPPIFGFFSWLIAYLIFILIFGQVLRKSLDVV